MRSMGEERGRMSPPRLQQPLSYPTRPARGPLLSPHSRGEEGKGLTDRTTYNGVIPAQAGIQLSTFSM